MIESLKISVEKLKGQGDDFLDNTAIKIDGQWVSYREYLKRLEQSIVQNLNDIRSSVDKCRADAATPQMIIDIAVLCFTNGLSALAPGKMLHVSAQELLAGYPFGGPNAFVPSLREHVLVRLSLDKNNNDFVVLIRDPVSGSANFIKSVAGNPAFKVDTTFQGGVLGGENSFFRKNLGIKW